MNKFDLTADKKRKRYFIQQKDVHVLNLYKHKGLENLIKLKFTEFKSQSNLPKINNNAFNNNGTNDKELFYQKITRNLQHSPLFQHNTNTLDNNNSSNNIFPKLKGFSISKSTRDISLCSPPMLSSNNSNYANNLGNISLNRSQNNINYINNSYNENDNSNNAKKVNKLRYRIKYIHNYSNKHNQSYNANKNDLQGKDLVLSNNYLIGIGDNNNIPTVVKLMQKNNSNKGIGENKINIFSNNSIKSSMIPHKLKYVNLNCINNINERKSTNKNLINIKRSYNVLNKILPNYNIFSDNINSNNTSLNNRRMYDTRIKIFRPFKEKEPLTSNENNYTDIKNDKKVIMEFDNKTNEEGTQTINDDEIRKDTDYNPQYNIYNTKIIINNYNNRKIVVKKIIDQKS